MRTRHMIASLTLALVLVGTFLLLLDGSATAQGETYDVQAAGGGPGQTLSQAHAASGKPAVQSINPVSNTHTAPTTSSVSITYDQPISAATVSTQTFAVHAMETGLLTQTYGVSGGMIILTPTDAFKPGELVQVSATTGTLNITGTGPLAPNVWQFRAATLGGSGRHDSRRRSYDGGDDSPSG